HQRCDPRSRPGRIASLFIKRSFRHSSKRLLHAPASGYRNWTTGDLSVVGTIGYFWSSSPAAADNASGGGMCFSAVDIPVLFTCQRARAFPVRCVQHLQGCFYGLSGLIFCVLERKTLLL
ncbi:MAG: fibrobacter succinogenes major paralogous domain-containing protein, partial [Alistipes sp.]|nr:fibrobacter succinogenes major paralogous domain-containing protein [Alistipes sp.]